MNKRYIARVIDIKDFAALPEEFLPLAEFKAGAENRGITGREKVAILNVETTSSYIPIFLDPWKGIEDVEKEVEEFAHADLHYDSKVLIKNVLRNIRKRGVE